MSERTPPQDLAVEPAFDAFVEEFGGRLVKNLFANRSSLPLNADYFFDERRVVAELKCLEKDYFRDQRVGEKADALLRRWVAEGRTERGHIRNGLLRINEIGEDCAWEVFRLFFKPVEGAVKDANRQIKRTKEHFGLPDARGLLILANDGNYSLTPDLSMRILANLLPHRYTGIDSFVYFTPNMRLAAPGRDRQVCVWISGPARPSAHEVPPEFLNRLWKGWSEYLGRLEEGPITTFEEEDHDRALRGMRFVHDE